MVYAAGRSDRANEKGRGFEFHLLAIAIALALIVVGAGAWSLDGALTAAAR
jgi:putative oxidoreductase